jgi:hypothetical protein
MSRKQRDKQRMHGFGSAIVVKNEQTEPHKEIDETMALKRLSKDSLEALRQGKTVNQSKPHGQSVKVLNEEATIDPPPSVDPQPPATLTLSREELTAIAQLAAEAAIAPLNEQVATLQIELEAAKVAEAEKIAAVEAAKQSAEDKLAVFSNLFKLTGNPEPVAPKIEMPAVNAIINSKSDKPQGALAEFMSIQGPVRTLDEEQFVSSATPEHQRFIKQNLNSLIIDLETYGRNNGMFRGRSSGNGTIADTNAVTQISDLPGGFLETLSPIVRETHQPSTIFWQFADNRIDFTAGKGDTIDVYRSPLAAPIVNPDDRLLSGGGVYADIVSTTDSVQTGIVKIVVNEWGRGKPGSGVSPLGIARFTQTFSMIETLQIIDRVLMHDYELWEDLKCRRMWTPTSRVVYNGNDSVVTLPASVPTVAQGHCTWQFLNELFGYMRGLQIPTYRDGCYGIALTTKAATQLKASLGIRYQFETVVDAMALTNILNLAEPGEKGKVTGYLGKIENFHVFESNNFSAGATGTEGVRTETTGAGAATTRSCFAFGASSFGRGIAEPFQLVADEVTNFRRRTRITWISWEGFGAMDVDPVGYADTSAVPQQLRVLDVRFTD